MASTEMSVADEKAPSAGLSRYSADGEEEQDGGGDGKSKLSGLLWHGGSAYDAWFSCASNQVAQVLLTLPYSFAQLGMVSGILFQLFYGLLGSWTAYLISILYLEYRTRKEKDKVDFRNHVIQVLVRGAGRAAGAALEERGAGLQLHLPAVRVGDPAHRLRQQHLLRERPPGQADLDIHLRRLLRHHRLHPVLPQLQGVVLPGPPHDHLHRMVHRRRLPHARPGRRRQALRPNHHHALLHRRHQHPLHLRGPRCHRGGDARYVAPSEVQGDLPAGDNVRAHPDAAFGVGGVLGVRRRAAHALQRAVAAPPRRVARRRRDPNAHPPVHHLRLRVHPPLLRVGEAHRAPRLPQPLQARRRQAPRRRPHLVPCHHFPFLRPHQLRRRLPSRQLHRLHHPSHGAHGHLPITAVPRERGGAAAEVRRRMDGGVRDQLVRGGVGAGRRLRLRRLGQHHQLRAAGVHLRPLRQVLPVPAPPRRRRVAVAVHRPEPVDAVRVQHDRHVRPDVGPVSCSGSGSDAFRVPSPPPPAPPPRLVIIDRKDDDVHHGWFDRPEFDLLVSR